MGKQNLNRPVTKMFLLSLLLLVSLFIFSVTAYGNSGVTWTPEDIKITIGNGKSITQDMPVAFVSAEEIKDAEIWITPEIRPFIKINKTTYDVIPANTPMTIYISFMLPPNATQGLFTGTIHIRSNEKSKRTFAKPLKVEVKVDFGDIVISNRAKVLTEEVASLILSISADQSQIIFSKLNPELAKIIPGDIIIFGVTPQTPVGLMRKVTSITVTADKVIFNTIPANLNEVILNGTIEISQQIKPDYSQQRVMVTGNNQIKLLSQANPASAPEEGFFVEFSDVVLLDVDGNESTTFDQIITSGFLNINPYLDLKLNIDSGTVKYFHFLPTLTIAEKLEAEAKVNLVRFNKKIAMPSFLFSKLIGGGIKPIWVWVGEIPLIFTVGMSPYFTTNGSVYVGLTTGVTQTNTGRVGVKYENNEWASVAELNSNFEFQPPRPEAGAELKVAVGLDLELKLYAAIGPYVKGQYFSLFEADIFDTPWWKLYAGYEWFGGFRAGIPFFTLTEWESPSRYVYKDLLASATTPPPVLNGSIAGSVKDAITNTPLADVQIRVYNEDSLVCASGKTDIDGKYKINVQAGDGYKVVFSKTGFVEAMYYQISVQNFNTTYLETIMQIDQAHSGQGAVGGKIVDALSGYGLSGVGIQLREGINQKTGTVIASTSTNLYGSYIFSQLKAGYYTAEALKTGFNNTYFTIICIGSATTGNQNATMTPILSENEIRIILTWGASPRDLDSHLTGPLPDGTRFHMYYPYADIYSPWPQYVKLDLDDTTSYGPETTTIYQQINGTYRFTVHDYTNSWRTDSTALSNSQAQVKVYKGNQLLNQFNVPSQEGGTVWTVFEMDGNTITPINTLSYETNPYNIRSVGGYNQDLNIFNNLPEKK